MEGLTAALQGFDWSTLGKTAGLGLSGAGLIGNLLTQKQRSDELNYVKQQQAALADPTKLSAEVAAATQPLNRGLTEEVSNVVGGNLAAQGLSQAPGIQATALSQALAPFQQQNQDTALKLVLARLGLPLEYASTYLSGLPQNTNLAPLLALLMGKPGAGGVMPTPGYQNYGPTQAQGGYNPSSDPYADITSTLSSAGFPALGGFSSPAPYSEGYDTTPFISDAPSPSQVPWLPSLDTGVMT